MPQFFEVKPDFECLTKGSNLSEEMVWKLLNKVKKNYVDKLYFEY